VLLPLQVLLLLLTTASASHLPASSWCSSQLLALEARLLLLLL
jgi:hypothetical protein